MFLNPLRQKIADGKPVIGPILQEIPDSPDLVEFLGSAGFDYVMVDGEHAGVGVKGAREMARAAESVGICALARVPDADPARILAFLDSGIQGIILAHCNTADDAEALVGPCKYPPRGIRGASSGSRAARYGYFASSSEKADIFDRETMCLGPDRGAARHPQRRRDARRRRLRRLLPGRGRHGADLEPGLLRPGADPPRGPEADRPGARRDAGSRQAGHGTCGSGAAAKALIDSGIQMVVVQFGQFFRAACDGYLKAARGE